MFNICLGRVFSHGVSPPWELNEPPEYFPGPSELSGPETRVADSVPHWRSETRGFARLRTYYIHQQPTTGQSLRQILLQLVYVILTPVSEGGYYFPRFADEVASSEHFNHGANVTKPQTRFCPEPLLKSEHVLLRDKSLNLWGPYFSCL